MNFNWMTLHSGEKRIEVNHDTDTVPHNTLDITINRGKITMFLNEQDVITLCNNLIQMKNNLRSSHNAR